MGNNGGGGSKFNSDEIVLLLFTLFGRYVGPISIPSPSFLVVLSFFLIVVVFQTWALWRMARVVVEQNTPSDMEGLTADRRKSSSFGGFFGGGGGAGAGATGDGVVDAGKKRYE
ncbi:hypothetical protein K504DRAFT_508702 [Pleomassaria siparia CBS 279.74]|uniref:Uncharacterized protein n=1 Tax=Pleomassaria siparia CBS 279.74 TaxID=1314801 RepID=A0A6G1JQ42_9PLEO|nr:hypothetical protein K504DRAFT_508702 [Pleomassaria siparia CBS 279.74]